MSHPRYAHQQPVDETPVYSKDTRCPSRKDVESSWDDEEKLHELLSNYTVFHFFIQTNNRKDHEFCQQLMRHIIQFPTVFDAIFVERADIVRLSQRVSHPLAEIAVEFMISNSDELKRLVKDERDVDVLNKYFSKQCQLAIHESEVTVERTASLK